MRATVLLFTTATALGALALAAAPAATAAPAQTPRATASGPAGGHGAPAAHGATGLYAPSVLVLTRSRGASADAPAERAVMLRCRPLGGDHPAAADACAALRSAGGDPAALPRTVGDETRVCTTELRPVTVTVRGVWDGRRVDHRQTFPNSCRLAGQTAAVFAF